MDAGKLLKIGRNQKCPCGSGKKYKKCCLHRPQDGDPEACLGDESRTGVVRGAAWPPTLILSTSQDKQDLCRCIGNYGNASKQSRRLGVPIPFGLVNEI